MPNKRGKVHKVNTEIQFVPHGVTLTKTTEGFHPSGNLALGSVARTELAPVTNFDVVGCFDDVSDVVARVNLEKVCFT